VTALRVGSLEARYHLPPSARGLRQRLDDALQVVLDGTLERELARLGLPDGGVLWIGAVHVPVLLSFSGPLVSMAEAWAQAIAEAIVEAVRGGRAANVVWYPSRRHVLLDFAAGVAVGDLAREWVWRRVTGFTGGPLSAPHAALLWCEAIGADPIAVVPVLAALAESRVLERLLEKIPPGEWMRLATVAAGPSGTRTSVAADVPLIVNERPDVGVPTAIDQPGLPPEWSEHHVAELGARVVARSILLRAYRRAAARSPDRETALCVLAVLEVEPAVRTAGEWLVRRIADVVRARLSPPAKADPLPHDAGSLLRKEPAAADAPFPPADPRRRAWTDFGGLLFLVGLAGDLGIPRRLLDRARESGRSVRWLLHQLAVRLVPVGSSDPAVLAFAGLPPDAVPPDAQTDPPAADEDEYLRGLVAEVAAALGERLGLIPEADGDLVGFVCRRQAEIVADPGWFEVRLPLDGVSTDVRRAGLDLDPGYVPWLGVVLKFVYG
jgi:hypothetical protein